MRATGRSRRRLTPLDSLDDGRQPVSDIQRGRLTRQDVIAQRPQCYGQIAEQDLGGGVLLARAVAADQRDQPASVGDNLAVPDPTTCIL